MHRKQFIALALITSTSCIFGGGSGKNSTDNNGNNVNNDEMDVGEANNGTDMGADMNTPPDMAPPPDMTMPPVDMTIPPDMPREERYLTLDAEEVNCPSPTTAWFAPNAAAGFPPITEESFVTTAAAPTEGLQPYLGGEASVAYATKQADGTIGVFAAVVARTQGDDRFLELKAAFGDIDVAPDAELYGISLTRLAVDRMAAPTSDILSVLLPTSEGVFNCVVRIDVADDATMSCEKSPWDQTVADLEIDQPARLDPAPIFERFQGNYILNFLGFDILAAVSGPGANGSEVLGLLKANTDGAVQQVDILGVDPTLPAGGTFGERLAFGVTTNSFGAPVLLMLHNTPQRGLQPIALRSDDFEVELYTPLATLGEWRLSSRIQPTREGFTFIDEYDIDQSLWLVFLGVQFPHSTARASFGYVGITSDGNALVLSRPGGFGGQDFLEFEISNAFEVVAFKNVPISATASSRAPLAVIHGQNRDRLALLDWGFNTDATYIDDLLAGGFANAKRMAPNWWLDDAGTISMLAQRETEWVVAAVPIPDLKNLSTACQ